MKIQAFSIQRFLHTTLLHTFFLLRKLYGYGGIKKSAHLKETANGLLQNSQFERCVWPSSSSLSCIIIIKHQLEFFIFS